MTPILAKVEMADALILGSPNYIGSLSAAMKAFLERLIYPYVVYDSNMSSLFGKKISTGFIYTMSSKDEWMKAMGYDQTAKFIERVMEVVFGSSESLVVNDTYQFDDYSKYVATRFNPDEKAQRRESQFPVDCKHAYEMGVRLIQK